MVDKREPPPVAHCHLSPVLPVCTRWLGLPRKVPCMEWLTQTSSPHSFRLKASVADAHAASEGLPGSLLGWPMKVPLCLHSTFPSPVAKDPNLPFIGSCPPGLGRTPRPHLNSTLSVRTCLHVRACPEGLGCTQLSSLSICHRPPVCISSTCQPPVICQTSTIYLPTICHLYIRSITIKR